MDDPADDAALSEAQRLRSALQRRGPVEAGLTANRGQLAIVRERDRAVEALIRAYAPGPTHLLDLGCGYGSTLGALIESGAVASGAGVDVLPERIATARLARPGIEFKVADARHLPFPGESFDVVLAMTTFSSVPRSARPAIATEIARVLRPGGVFVWYDMRLPSPSNSDVQPFKTTDVAALFPDWAIQARRLTLLPPLARRLGPATEMLYAVFTRVPFLLSHEVGAARRPTSP